MEDYRFEDYATINVLSLIYALCQGGAIGASIGFVIQCFGLALSYPSNFSSYIPLFFSLTCLLALVIVRLVIESYALIYRAIQDYIKNQNLS